MTYTHKHCADIGCSLKDLPDTIDRECMLESGNFMMSHLLDDIYIYMCVCVCVCVCVC